jgi:SNF2 family DNA or RNA helicase
MDKPPPTFDRAFCIELAGGQVFRQAQKLYESHAVLSVDWVSPVLIAKVKGLSNNYAIELNLRSTVFPENNCSCILGRKGKICAHAVAAALQFQAMLNANSEKHCDSGSTDIIQPITKESTKEVSQIKAKVTKEPVLNSVVLDNNGTRLRLLIFLPPNLKEAAERNGIALKIDAATGHDIIPLNRICSSEHYCLSKGHLQALQLIESWCGGQLAARLELNRLQFMQLVNALHTEPAIYWLKNPQEPILWDGEKLVGVHEKIELVEEEIKYLSIEKTKGFSKKKIQSPISLRKKIREQSKPNPRRTAEAKAPGLFTNCKNDYPNVPTQEKMNDYPLDRIVVDGTAHYLAIRLPRGDDSIRPLRDLLKTSGFILEPSNRKWWLRDRGKTLNFLAGNLLDLKEHWRAVFTDHLELNLKELNISQVSIHTDYKDGQFRLNMSLAQDVNESDMRRAIATGRNYVESSSGKITLLERKSMERFHGVEKAISGQIDRPFTPSFSKRLDGAELLDVEELLDEVCVNWQPPQAWQSRSQALKQIAALDPAPIRSELDSVLRTYQRIGAAWLWHLYRHQLGGILADEMGLGKTLQALALIECIHSSDDSNSPSLVVCPASLVENWVRECARFTPQLEVLKHHGLKRAKESVVLEDADLVITSYSTLRQDEDLMSTMDWSVVIGDEAQHIKNKRSQNAKTLCSLHTKGRFLLTGTPVENSLDDLLSLFNFLMPGYLQKSEGKCSQEDRIWHRQRQAKRAASYILRRSKKAVAPELPDKIEKTFFCDFSPRQAQLYQDTLERTRREIFEMEMSGANAGRVQFAAFKELLRLRQVCVDPRLLDKSFLATDSSKLTAMDEILHECIENGSRILVFSSFVSALKLLSEHLNSKGIQFCYLDGSSHNRQDICDTFNTDDKIPVFLISLKAGGTGLNLTGADTVVHYDPWWNPAAEAQATDRAHRIGQQKVVTSIKLIAANTVEERVLDLQVKKAALLTELFEESAAVNAVVNIEKIKELLD